MSEEQTDPAPEQQPEVVETVEVTEVVVTETEVNLPPVESVLEKEQDRFQGLKISGVENDISEEDYKKVYCRAVNDGDKIDFYLKPIKDQTPEELVDTIGNLTKFMIQVKVIKQAAKITLEDRKITLSSEQRELLRLRDQQYKPKKVEDPNKPKKVSAPRRKVGTAKLEDAAQMMANLLGISLEDAKKMIDNSKEE